MKEHVSIDRHRIAGAVFVSAYMINKYGIHDAMKRCVERQIKRKTGKIVTATMTDEAVRIAQINHDKQQ